MPQRWRWKRDNPTRAQSQKRDHPSQARRKRRLPKPMAKELVTKMADEQLDRLESFRVFITAAEEGGAIPPVAEHDLKCLHELCVERAKRYCGKDGVVSIDSMASACSPDANLPAVWLRHAQLRSMYRQGLLAEWQHGTALDDAVFRLAATIPMNGIHLDQEAFVLHLRVGTAQPELTIRSPQLLKYRRYTHWSH